MHSSLRILSLLPRLNRGGSVLSFASTNVDASSPDSYQIRHLPLFFTMSSRPRNSSGETSKPKKRKRDQPPRPRSKSGDDREWFFPFTKNDPLYVDYMTNEWGIEKPTDQELFEKLCLEGAQSGLSWRTMLHKRSAYRKAFHGFEIDRVASMTRGDIDELLSRTSDNTEELVVRHRGKLESIVNNATIIQQLKSDGTISSLKEYLWSFVNGRPILNRWQSFSCIPSTSKESECMSKSLKKHGFKFVGPTTCYALMQSCGFVIDHPIGTAHWAKAERRLKKRKGGYQLR